MADKKVSELDAIIGADTASDDLFLIVDSSGSVTKKITREELNNAIERDVLSSIDINGGTIDATPIGGTTPAAGSFTTVGTTGDLTAGANIVVTGTVDGRDVAADGTKLDGVEASADVTDATNVQAAGALMDSELTSEASVKALNQGVATTDDPSFVDATFTGTGAVKMPAGTTAQRPTAAQGQIRFNTTDTTFEGYDGSAWGAIGGDSGETSLILYEYTATSGQTTFSGSDDNAATLSYTADNIQVVMNGIVLDPSDYTATNGTSVVLASGAAANDIVNIYAFKSFTVADTVSASAGGTFSANVAITGDLTVDTNTLYVDSTNNAIGIGETDPLGTVHIRTSDASLTSVNANADDLILEGNGNTGMSICSSTSGEGNINFIDNGDTNIGRIQYTHSDNKMQFRTNDGIRMTLDSSGRVGIGTSSPAQKFVVSNAGANNIVMSENSSASIQMFMQAQSSVGAVGTLTNHNLNFLQNNTIRMTIDSGGSVLVGSTSFAENGSTNSIKIHPHEIQTGTTTTGANTHLAFSNPNGRVGSIITNGSGTAYNTSSDHRLKEAVVDMTGAIDRVKQLAPKRFNFIADADTTVDGFLAHEAQTVVPEAVTGEHNEVDEDGNAVMQGIDQSKLVPLLTGALQEAIAKIETLETKVAALEAAE